MYVKKAAFPIAHKQYWGSCNLNCTLTDVNPNSEPWYINDDLRYIIADYYTRNKDKGVLVITKDDAKMKSKIWKPSDSNSSSTDSE